MPNEKLNSQPGFSFWRIHKDWLKTETEIWLGAIQIMSVLQPVWRLNESHEDFSKPGLWVWMSIAMCALKLGFEKDVCVIHYAVFAFEFMVDNSS